MRTLGLRAGRQLRPLLLTWLPAFSSLALVLAFAGFALHIRLGLGHWPKPMVESYGTPLADFHVKSLILFGIFAVYVAGPLWLLMLCFKPLRISLPIHIRQVLLFGFGWLLLYIWVRRDPFRFIDWFLDLVIRLACRAIEPFRTLAAMEAD